MKHIGSVTDIKGNEIEPVDVITFGSPCQDLSVAGKRAGLKHTENGDEETTRSGLFMDAVRIIKEMREATNGKYPRFAVWENVPGAFSSNKGEDFRIVLEELIKIVEPTAVMPAVPKNGWNYADHFRGDGWSLAYRVLDAQYWGVPQRRRRIYLVLDLGGECAGQVSFEREGLRGYFAESRTPWKAVAGDAENCPGAADCKGEISGVIPINTMIATRHKQLGRGTGFGLAEMGDPQFTISAGHEHAVAYTLKIRSGCDGGGKGALIQNDKSATLSTLNDQYLFQPVTLEPGIAQREGGHVYEGVSGTLRANAGDNQMAVAYAGMVLDDQGGQQISVRTDGKSPTLRAEMHGNVPCVMEAAECIKEQHLFENHSQDARYKGPLDVCPMLPAQLGTGGNNTPLIAEATPAHDQPVYCLQGNGIDRADTAGCNGKGIKEDICYTRNTIDRPAVAYGTDVGFFNSLENQSPTLLARGYKDPHLVTYPASEIHYIVRRLTPTECARLQGFPDDWAHPDQKSEFTDEEYEFWLRVRNTHAEINGKAAKSYSKDQMLNWYNKLHTDSAEYKLWGNGIALPCALYVMQGIAEVFARERN